MPIFSCGRVLGKRVRAIIEAYVGQATFFVPAIAFAEAEEHLPALVIKRQGDPQKALALLHSLGSLVEQVGDEVYGEFEAAARDRLGGRDPEDWPILACALAIGCPIWTEDTDFSGVAWPLGLLAESKCSCANSNVTLGTRVSWTLSNRHAPRSSVDGSH